MTVNEAGWDRAIRVVAGLVLLYLGWGGVVAGTLGTVFKWLGFLPLLTGIILQGLLQTPAEWAQSLTRSASASSQSGARASGKIGAGLLFGGAVLAGLLRLAQRGNNRFRWDSSGGRYRGLDGRFRSG